MATILQLRMELKECQEQLKRWQIEEEYQRRWKRYWWKRYNISTRKSPLEKIEEPKYKDVREHFEMTGSLYDEEKEIS